jgi:hypothetical protein
VRSAPRRSSPSPRRQSRGRPWPTTGRTANRPRHRPRPCASRRLWWPGGRPCARQLCGRPAVSRTSRAGRSPGRPTADVRSAWGRGPSLRKIVVMLLSTAASHGREPWRCRGTTWPRPSRRGRRARGAQSVQRIVDPTASEHPRHDLGIQRAPPGGDARDPRTNAPTSRPRSSSRKPTPSGSSPISLRAKSSSSVASRGIKSGDPVASSAVRTVPPTW